MLNLLLEHFPLFQSGLGNTTSQKGISRSQSQSTTASICLYCQVWAFLAGHTPGLNLTSLDAHSTCHGKVSCLYLTTGLGVRTTSLCHLHHLVGPNHPLAWFFISLLCI